MYSQVNFQPSLASLPTQKGGGLTGSNQADSTNQDYPGIKGSPGRGNHQGSNL